MTYRRYSAWILHAGITLFVILFIIWLPNIHFLIDSLWYGHISFFSWLRLIFTSFGTLRTAIPVLDAIFAICISFFFGMQIALMTYLIKERVQSHRAMGIGGLGLVFGILGIGCSACGSILLTTVLGLGLSGAVLRGLPLHGSEFSLIGILLLLLSIALTAKQIASPPVCAIK